MSAKDLLRELRSSGVEVSARDGYIDLDAPRGVLTDELIEAVAKAKPRLLKLLDREQRKLEEAERRGLIIKWAREPGWIALHDPTSGEWQGGKVIREYIGAGTLGELAAKTDALRRLRREREGMAWREERESLEALDRALGELDEAAEILARAALYAAGYHRHNRSE